jgi:hypothetical protein
MLVNFLTVIPHLLRTGAKPFGGRYAPVGDSLSGMAHTLVTHPGAVVTNIANRHRRKSLGFVVGPVLVFWLLVQLLVFGAFPDLAVDLLSGKREETSIVFQHSPGIGAFLVPAAVLGAAGLVAAVVLVYIQTPRRRSADDIAQARAVNRVHAAKAHALLLVPVGVSVWATNKLAGYESGRQIVHVFLHVRKARSLVLENDDQTQGAPEGDLCALEKTDASRRWRAVRQAERVYVLVKRQSSG